MPTTATRIASVVLGLALWVQLVGLPAWAAPGGPTSVPALAWVLAIAAIVVLVAAGALSEQGHRTLRPTLLLAAFPAVLAAASVAVTRTTVARFDVVARSIAALTAVAYMIASVAWSDHLAPAMDVSLSAIDRPARATPEPVWMRPALAAVLAVAAFAAVVAPGLLAGRPASGRIERIGGEPLALARESLASAGGLGIAMLLLLVGGGALVRGKSAPRRGGTRALAFVTWACAAGGLYWLLERLR